METTRAYYMSHILLRNKIFLDSKNFSKNLSKGSQGIKKYLLDLWNSIDEKFFKEGTIITDINRIVTIEDFDVTYRRINEKDVFFFIMPDPDSYNSQAKAVAFIVDKSGMIRYITMEIWTKSEQDTMRAILGDNYKPQYTIGEWSFNENNFMHLNLGRLPRNTVECFASFLEERL